jgi:hypothetical protein
MAWTCAKKHWILVLIGVMTFALGGAAFFALPGVASRRIPANLRSRVPVPALDLAVARLAAEARARMIAANTGAQANAEIR